MALTHQWLTDRILYCCLSQEQQTQLQEDLDNKKHRTAYLLQQNLVREKDGFRCSICGKFYPSLQIWYRGEAIDPKHAARIAGKPEKFKKAATVFCQDHYYAQNKKTLLKFEIDADREAKQTDEIPIMGGVYHTILSGDEKYIATETFGGTVGITDLAAKRMIASRRQRKINGAFAFSKRNELLYFFQDAIRCWNFIEDEEEIIWRVPGEWKAAPQPVCVVCTSVVCNSRENTYWFQCNAGRADYAVVIKDLMAEKVVQLPRVPSLHHLVYALEQGVYTLTTEDSILLLDESGQIRETHACPQIQTTMDGGGTFCITRFSPRGPRRAFLSPDGTWLLLDFWKEILLLKRADGRIHHCICSGTGSAAPHMGFADDRHFWYVRGDTTYIQEVPEEA